MHGGSNGVGMKDLSVHFIDKTRAKEIRATIMKIGASYGKNGFREVCEKVATIEARDTFAILNEPLGIRRW